MLQVTLIATGTISNDPIKLRAEKEKEQKEEEQRKEASEQDPLGVSSPTPAEPTPSVSVSPTPKSPPLLPSSNRDVASTVHFMLSHQPSICLDEFFFLPSRTAFESPIDTELYFLVCF